MRKKWFLALPVVIVLTLLCCTVPASATSVQMPVQAPERCGVVHVVQPGDTLYSIARRYGADPMALAAANGIVNPNRIYVGQRIVISACRPSGKVHVVQRGETLTHIALRYGMSVWTLARANNIANINWIYVGQQLVIPGAAPPPQPQPQPQPAPSADFPGPWSGEYFDNVTLAGDPYVTRDDANINFNWAYGPPAGGMPTNSFSVRWKGTFYFAAGTYRFYAKVDDGVRLYVDGELIINGWRDGALRTYTKDRTMTAGDHAVQVEYYDRVQVAKAYVWWKAVSWAAPTATPGPTSTPSAAPPSDQWYVEFFNNEDLAGSPVATRYDPWIGFDWGTSYAAEGVWQDGFSARWTRILPLETDHYRFCAMSDDGVRVWVGGQLVLDEWHANGGTTYCGTYWAASGDYEVKVEYYEHGGNALIYVWWEPH